MVKEYNKVYNFLNIKPLNEANYNLEFESNDSSSINIKMYNLLENFYKKDVKMLEELIGFNTGWNI